MDIRFYIDRPTGAPHIYTHGVSEREVEDVLRRPGEDRAGRDDSRVALGQSREGRFLRVIYVPDEDGRGIFVITAYDLVGKPLKAYKRRVRRKRK
jgi:CBS domain-containing protein